MLRAAYGRAYKRKNCLNFLIKETMLDST